jgi:hypothetical protein
MLETVDSSGHIALGKQFAGQRFSVHVKEGGVLVLEPFPELRHTPLAGGVTQTPSAEHPEHWVQENRSRIEAYNAWADQRPTFSASVQAWRRARSEQVPETSGDS